MNTRPLLTATLLVASVAVVVAVDKCEFDCVGHEQGDMVSDPMNCTQYYICTSDVVPSDVPLSCGSGFHFDPEVSACVLGEDCDPICPNYFCHMACDYPADLIADSKYCNIYYVCDAALHRGPALQCPEENPYFGEGYCLSDDSYCCQPQCKPYCGPDDVQVIDPTDCTKYYICTGEGTPNEVNHHSCPAGETFDVASSRCSPNQPCVILCDDTITPTTHHPDCESSYTSPEQRLIPS